MGLDVCTFCLHFKVVMLTEDVAHSLILQFCVCALGELDIGNPLEVTRLEPPPVMFHDEMGQSRSSSIHRDIRRSGHRCVITPPAVIDLTSPPKVKLTIPLCSAVVHMGFNRAVLDHVDSGKDVRARAINHNMDANG